MATYAKMPGELDKDLINITARAWGEQEETSGRRKGGVQ